MSDSELRLRQCCSDLVISEACNDRLHDQITRLTAEIDDFWEHLHNSYDIGSREELERESLGWNPPNPLAVVLHHIWKRNPKVVKLQAKIDNLAAALQKYGIHGKQCRGRDYPDQCECGFSEAVKGVL